MWTGVDRRDLRGVNFAEGVARARREPWHGGVWGAEPRRRGTDAGEALPAKNDAIGGLIVRDLSADELDNVGIRPVDREHAHGRVKFQATALLCKRSDDAVAP